jgi:hypothetical protein
LTHGRLGFDASLGLDRLSGPLGNRRRCHHSALVPQRFNLPIESITRWSSLVADPYLLILACQLLDHLLNRHRCAIDLAEIPRLPSRPASATATACFFFAVSIPTKTSPHFGPSLVLFLARRGGPPRLNYGHNV